ncbi:MAG: hypothetical protein J3K34DRAFT_482952, partial [Monoraphidium minutum]
LHVVGVVGYAGRCGHSACIIPQRGVAAWGIGTQGLLWRHSLLSRRMGCSTERHTSECTHTRCDHYRAPAEAAPSRILWSPGQTSHPFKPHTQPWRRPYTHASHARTQPRSRDHNATSRAPHHGRGYKGHPQWRTARPAAPPPPPPPLFIQNVWGDLCRVTWRTSGVRGGVAATNRDPQAHLLTLPDGTCVRFCAVLAAYVVWSEKWTPLNPQSGTVLAPSVAAAVSLPTGVESTWAQTIGGSNADVHTDVSPTLGAQRHVAALAFDKSRAPHYFAEVTAPVAGAGWRGVGACVAPVNALTATIASLNAPLSHPTPSTPSAVFNAAALVSDARRRARLGAAEAAKICSGRSPAGASAFFAGSQPWWRAEYAAAAACYGVRDATQREMCPAV